MSLNLYNLHFIMLIGLPGSGKSTYVKKLTDSLITYDVHSSDAIRGELYGDENCQDNPSIIFEEMFKRTVNSLNNKRNVIYDATNINRKKRIELLTNLNKEVKNKFDKIAVVVYADLETCKLRNSLRERKVPNQVIDRMIMNFELPVKGEGWDGISIEYTTTPKYNYATAVNEIVGPEPHVNHWHNLDIDLHMYCALDYFEVKYEAHAYPEYLRYAILFHDLGKKFCKTFINKKGEQTEEAHYYQHANVGAYFALDVNFDDFQGYNIDGTVTTKFTDEEKYNMAVLINYHMRPLEAWKDSKKSMNKDKKILGDEMFNYLEIVHDCDETSEMDNEWVATFLGTHLPDTYRKYGLNWHKYTNPLKEIDFSYD